MKLKELHIVQLFCPVLYSPIDNEKVAVRLYDLREDLFIPKLTFCPCIRSPCLYAEHVSKYIEDNN